MPNNFSIVEHKVFEADFFLDKMKECSKTISEFSHAEYYFSAFLSASRSITFTMQNAFSEFDGFDVWYVKKQSALRQSDLANFFKEARNNKSWMFRTGRGSSSYAGCTIFGWLQYQGKPYRHRLSEGICAIKNPGCQEVCQCKNKLS
jgi:hypothetical protein